MLQNQNAFKPRTVSICLYNCYVPSIRGSRRPICKYRVFDLRFLGWATFQWDWFSKHQSSRKPGANPHVQSGGRPGENAAWSPKRIRQKQLQRKLSVQQVCDKIGRTVSVFLGCVIQMIKKGCYASSEKSFLYVVSFSQQPIESTNPPSYVERLGGKQLPGTYTTQIIGLYGKNLHITV